MTARQAYLGAIAVGVLGLSASVAMVWAPAGLFVLSVAVIAFGFASLVEWHR